MADYSEVKYAEPNMLVVAQVEASDNNNRRTETDCDIGDGNAKFSQVNGAKNQDDVDPELDDLFSMRRPKDALAGFGSGLKNIGKGVVMGVGAAVVCPVHGAKTGGFKGAATGLGSGLLAAVALPVCGIATGVMQMGRGVINTPAAINEGIKGEKTWDKKNRVWFRYNLKDEAKLVLDESEEDFIKRMTKENKANLSNGNGESFNNRESQKEQNKPARKVKELEYYELLGVESNATPGQIKKAYYLKARKLHPDKNPDDPNANEKFQAVGAAYQVLSDTGLREKYDRLGKEGVDDAPLMDSAAFYMMIFGSEKFDAYVGQLKFATMMLLGEEMEGDGSEDFVESIVSSSTNLHLKYIQGKREVSCAQELAKKLDLYVEEVNASDDAKYEEFKKFIEAEAQELTAQAVGGTLLSVIGYVYMEQAKKQLGFKHSVGAGIGLVELRRKGHTIANNFRLVKSSIHGMRHASKEMEAENKEKEKDKACDGEGKEKGNVLKEDEKKKKEEREMESFLVMVDAIWNYSVLDVESTLRHVCQKVLFDNSVSVEARAKRAEGLYVMGKIFKEKGKSAKEGLSAFKDQFRAQINAQTPQETQSADEEASAAPKEN